MMCISLNAFVSIHSLSLSPPSLSSPSIANHNGSISAEHGLGFKKAKYIHYSKPQEAVQIMAQIKRVLDPLVSDCV